MDQTDDETTRTGRSGLRRRELVSICGALVAASLAGCTAGEEDGSEASEDSDIQHVDEVERAVELFYGEEARTSAGVTAVAESIQFVDIPSGTEAVPEAPEDGNQHAALRFEAWNESDDPQLLPANWDISLRYDGEQFERKRPVGDELDEYTGIEVQAGDASAGELLYEVPDDLSEDDLVAIWNDRESGYDATVEWSPR